MVILFWEYCGIQGDSFLPLLFIMCLFLLKQSFAGILADIDMVKTMYAKSLVNTIRVFSDNICMEFGFRNVN